MKVYKSLDPQLLGEMALTHPHLRAFENIVKLLPVIPRGRNEPRLVGNDTLNVIDDIGGNFIPYTGYIIFREKGDKRLQSAPTQILVNPNTGKVHEFSKQFDWTQFSYVTYIGLRVARSHPFSWIQNYQYLLEFSPLALMQNPTTKGISDGY